jgi:D-beta-D-heptose 7-phosphate kinase / D-beta-D-heptose 1-phosphate adenosyltransferase
MSSRLLVIGDALLDRDIEGHSERLCPDAPVPVVDELASHPRPGGAALAAALAVANGTPVTLVTALAGDSAGAELGRALVGAGVDLIDLGLEGTTPEKVRVLDRGRPLLRLDRGHGGEISSARPASVLRAAIAAAGAVLISDYGHGVAAHPGVREALAGRPPGTRLIWDPHPRGAEPVAGVSVMTPNLEEAAHFSGCAVPVGEDAIAALARDLLEGWESSAVCITRGRDGVLLALSDDGVWPYAAKPVEGDPCGAGDRFAAEVAAVLAAGGSREEAIASAVAAAAEFVAAGGARAAALSATEAAALHNADEQGVGRSPLSIEPALKLVRQVRAEGGVVVATGGCFDVLHAGHLRSLESARRLGDLLIVLLNGNRSVKRLKGDGRPLIDELERAAMLKALRCVDEVAIFDEETPVEPLRLLRPDVWAKGGEYASRAMPEAEALAAWGGRVAILPQLQGRSTTRLIERMR